MKIITNETTRVKTEGKDVDTIMREIFSNIKPACNNDEKRDERNNIIIEASKLIEDTSELSASERADRWIAENNTIFEASKHIEDTSELSASERADRWILENNF